jgi:hypothetical protein
MAGRGAQHESKTRQMLREMRELPSSRSLVLWFGVLGPPLAWAAHLLLGDGLYELGCGPGFADRTIYRLPLEFWGLFQTLLFLVIDIVAGVLAYGAHRRLHDEGMAAEVPNPTVLGRARGMALAGIGSAAIYGALLVYGVLPPLVLQTCSRSP